MIKKKNQQQQLEPIIESTDGVGETNNSRFENNIHFALQIAPDEVVDSVPSAQPVAYFRIEQGPVEPSTDITPEACDVVNDGYHITVNYASEVEAAVAAILTPNERGNVAKETSEAMQQADNMDISLVTDSSNASTEQCTGTLIKQTVNLAQNASYESYHQNRFAMSQQQVNSETPLSGIVPYDPLLPDINSTVPMS